MDKRVILTFVGTILITIALLSLKACRKDCVLPIVKANKTLIVVDEEVEFSAITESDEEIAWDFGDGKNGIGASIKHTYVKTGTYNVVANLNEKCKSLPFTIEVTNPKIKVIQALTLSLELPNKIEAEVEATFTVNNPELSDYNWQVVETAATSKESFLNVSFPSPGSYTIKLNALGDGFKGDTIFEVKVEKKSTAAIPVPSTLVISAPRLAFTGKSVNIICTTPYTSQYIWFIKETSQNFTGKSIQTKFDKPGNYTVSLSAIGNVQGKTFNLSKIINIIVKDAPEAKPVIIPSETTVTSDAELNELFVKLSGQLGAEDSNASDEWKDKIATLGCGKQQTTISIYVESALTETISLEQFKKKQIINNKYAVEKITSIKRGVNGCILQIVINASVND